MELQDEIIRIHIYRYIYVNSYVLGTICMYIYIHRYIYINMHTDSFIYLLSYVYL